jgi:hypothetical protein
MKYRFEKVERAAQFRLSAPQHPTPPPDPTTALSRGQERIHVPTSLLRRRCGKLASTNALPSYGVTSAVCFANLQLFVDALFDRPIELTAKNVTELSALCHEFEVTDLATTVAAFDSSPERTRLKQEQIDCLQAFVVDLQRQLCATYRTIRILNLKPDHQTMLPGMTPTDFSPLIRWNERINDNGSGLPKLKIEVHSVEAPEFQRGEEFELSKLVRNFDILFVGGSDRSFDGLDTITREHVITKLKPFWEGGGGILLFHNVFGGFEFFLDLFNFKQIQNHQSFTSATIMRPSRVMIKPFNLPTTIEIGETHGHFTADNPCTVLGNNGVTYYAQLGHLGMIEMCHQPPVTEHEWKLLVNIVYQLVL